MDEDRRALYNSLRMSWLLDQEMAVEPWQVEDYRTMSNEAIFERLSLQDINLDRHSFQQITDEYESPEELSDHLLEHLDADPRSRDQVYLLIFELWRRFLPEKPSLTIFCDELDHQIQLYDTGNAQNAEAIQDTIANLKVVLDENVDQGGDPVEVFQMIAASCANDVESFLYDFMAEQIDVKNFSYAAELLDAFEDYVTDIKWFEFLRVRQLAATDPESAIALLNKVVKESREEPDLEFNLEILAFLVQGGDETIFRSLLKQTIPLLQSEEDFQDLLMICADFYHLLDHDHIEQKIQTILKKRSRMPLRQTIDRKDPDLIELVKAMSN
jgi:hypothetical protein